MQRLPWVWLLPLLLLLGQHGQFRHEMGHYTRAVAKTQQHQPVDADRCEFCLAYAHLSVAAKPEAAVLRLRGDLAYHHAFERLHESADPALPAARNRGPPPA